MWFKKKKTAPEPTKIALVQFGYGKNTLYSITINGKSYPETNTMYKEEAERHFNLLRAGLKGEQRTFNILKEETV